MAIVIIADDLSGAAELAGIAHSHGLSAEVQREFTAATDALVIAVDTDTRLLAPEVAAKRVAEVTRAVVASRPAWIFKKTDSVLRGHPAAEIAAILSVTGFSRAVLAPANPSRGRTIVGGVYSIGGVPLDLTAFANDPEFPRCTALVDELLGDAPAVAVPDVADLAAVQRLAGQLDEQTLPAGAADYFTALLDDRCAPLAAVASAGVYKLQPPVLLVCGSRHSWPRREAACRAVGIPAITIHDSHRTAKQKRDVRAAAIGIGEPTPLGTNSASLLLWLARITPVCMEQLSVRTILVEGGATAAALVEQLHWKRFRVAATAPAGVGVLKPEAPSK